MPVLISLLLLIGVSGLLYLQWRTLIREMRTEVPHLFFSPHPAYRNRPVNRQSLFLRFSIGMRVFSVAVLILMVVIAAGYLLESVLAVY